MSAEMITMVIEDATEKMTKAVEHTRADFMGVRTGRAAPALIEKLMVDYYGAMVPLLQLASFSVPEARQLLVHPFDKGSMGAIEKAIQMSDLGLNPSNDGEMIRLAFPPLTEERRKALVKVVKGMAEEGRITVRSLRRQARHDLDATVSEGDISEDDVARAEKDLDKVTRSYESHIDQALAQKERELLED